MKRAQRSVAVLLIGSGTAAAWLFGPAILHEAQYVRAEQKVESSREQLATVQDLSSVFRNVGKVLEPAVVNINVRKTIKAPRSAAPFDDNLLKKFFPNQPPDQQPDQQQPDSPDEGANPGDGEMEQVGTGSGVIMEVDGSTGYILTNNHVAGGATEMVVTLADGRKIDNAKLVGADPKSDLAVVKIKADHLIPARWGDSSTLEKGDWVLAFGSPFGYVGSMTHGIVSALDRQAGILGNQGYEDFIQVDAPINPGNSGGPLVNIHGDVVGINTAIATRSGGFQGIGFAIPSNEAKFVYAALKQNGKVTRGWLGVSISDVSRDLSLAHSFGYSGDNGVLVEQTFEKTPAFGRLEKGDIITELNGKAVSNVTELRNAVASTTPGSELSLKVFRDGKIQDVALKVGEQPENLMAIGRAGGGAGPAASPGSADALGMKLATPDDAMIEKYNLKDLADAKGALVISVQARSAAAKAGIRPGDLITSVGGEKVASAKEAADAFTKQDLKKGVRVYLTNTEGSRFAFIEPQL